MIRSEGARRLVALMTVAAAVGAQSIATRSAVAHQTQHADHFGVQLLATQLEAPVSLAERGALMLAPEAAGPNEMTPSFVAPLTEPSSLDPVLKRQRSWRGISANELTRRDIGPARTLVRPLPNRDSVGSRLVLTENDVLIPIRLSY